MWSLLLLGTPQILRAGEPIQLPRRKNRALLYYLAAHTKPLTRQQLLAFFFIDHERSAAQQILRTMLHDLRKQLDDALLVRNESIALAPDVFVDARTLQARLQSPPSARLALPSTLELYRDDFLAGFSLADVPEFDDWAARERERYRELVMRGWMQVAAQYQVERDYTAALDALNRVLTFDALNEQAHCHALRVQYRNGDRAGAIRRFEQLQKRLDEELGVPPMAETRAVYDAIVTDTLEDAPSLADNEGGRAVVLRRRTRDESAATFLLPFIGRAGELKTLHRMAEAGKLLWVQGEAGIGKTRLAEEFIGSPENANAIVLRGAAHELEQNLPYQPILSALASLYAHAAWQRAAPTLGLAAVWWSELVRLTPELQTLLPNVPPPPPQTDEARLWEAIYQLVAHLAARQRVILFIDDAQWADTSTLGVLGYLARRASGEYLLLVTARQVELPPPAATLVQTLMRAEKMVRIEMQALQDRELHSLAAFLTPTHGAQLAAWLNEKTEGNPFFINELLRYAYDTNALAPGGALDLEALGPVLTPTIQNLIQSRVTRLNETTRRVLQYACVIGREFDFALLARAAGAEEDAVLDALDDLQRTGLVRAQDIARYGFDHYLTMQVIYKDLGAARQLVLHRRVADALRELYGEQLDPVAGLIARHLVQAGRAAQASSYMLRAAGYAARLAAWKEAIPFYEQALRGELDAQDRTRALLGLGIANIHSGNVARAADVLQQAFLLAQTQGDVAQMDSILVYLTQSFMSQGRYREGMEWARRASETGHDELVLAAEFTWGTALMVQGAQPNEAEAHLRSAFELLDAPRSFVSLVTAAKLYYQLAGVLGQQGKWQQAVKLYWQALALVRQDETALDLQRHILLYNNLAYYLHLLQDPAAADYARAGIALTREKGSLTHLPYLLSTSGEIALAHSDLDGAENFFQQGLQIAIELGNQERRAGLTANLGLVARARGDTELAIARLNQALDEAAQLNTQHLIARIHVWLVPLVPREQAPEHLETARRLAIESGFAQVLEQVEQLEKKSAE